MSMSSLREIDEPVGRLEAHRDRGMGDLEGAEMLRQPVGGECRHRADRQRALRRRVRALS